MKILFLTDAWPPQVSGVVTTLTKAVDLLRMRGHEVEVLYPGLFRTIPCPSYPEIRLAIFPGKLIRERIRAFRPDAIHIPTEGTMGLSARRVCRSMNLPFTTTFATRYPEYIFMRYGVPQSFLYGLLRWFHGGAARTSVATQGLKDELEARGFRNLQFWERGVDTELFHPYGKDALDYPRPISLYMGRVAVEKNIEAFLQASIPGTKVIIGDGPALPPLKEAYPDVKFPGKKSGEDLARHVAAADVFVFPSRTDTFGIVLIEAMACGVPVAAFPVVGPKDVVVHGETGWLDESLETAVTKALSLSPERCREHALRYSWDRSIDQFEALLERIAPDTYR